MTHANPTFPGYCGLGRTVKTLDLGTSKTIEMDVVVGSVFTFISVPAFANCFADDCLFRLHHWDPSKILYLRHCITLVKVCISNSSAFSLTSFHA